MFALWLVRKFPLTVSEPQIRLCVYTYGKVNTQKLTFLLLCYFLFLLLCASETQLY